MEKINQVGLYVLVVHQDGFRQWYHVNELIDAKQLANWLRELMQVRYNHAKAEACCKDGLLTLEDLNRGGYDPNDVEQAVRDRDGIIGRLAWRVTDLEKAVRLATDPKLRRVRGNLESAVKILNK